MSGLFFGINIGLKGLMANQTSLTVASHNIANADTEGYSRQRVDMQASYPLPGIMTGAGQLGSGVDVAEIKRIRQDFIDYQFREEASFLKRWEGIKDSLETVELVFMEPSDTGFGEALGAFWNGWQEVAKFGESSPLRTTLKEIAITLTDSCNDIHKKLQDIKDDIQTQIKIAVDEINVLSTSIADLNRQIRKVVMTGQNPNDLLDQRDLALDKLAGLTDFSKDFIIANGENTGAIEVKIGDIAIVDENGPVKIKYESGKVRLSAGSNPEIKITDGRIAGLMEVGGEDDITGSVQHYLKKLDELAITMAKAVNDLHKTGKTLDGSDGDDFFVFLDSNGQPITLDSNAWANPTAAGLSAANISVNIAIQNDVSQIAAAAQVPGGIFLPGNGDIALAIAQLKDNPLHFRSSNSVTTVDNFYKDLIAELGVVTNRSQRMVINQKALLNQAANKRESLVGVNIDEEMANMVNFQHAFQANARVISIMDRMLETVIGLIR